MGKYMRKTKNSGHVTVMEVSQSSLGVLTRAKTLALRRLQKSPSPAPSPPTHVSSGSYLQLRSRRLEKPTIAFSSHESKRQKQSLKEGILQNPNPNPRVSSIDQSSEEVGDKDKSVGENDGSEIKKENIDMGIEEASFGENVLDFESRERSTRESTPCSLIRNPDIIRTPSSTTRPTNTVETNHRSHYPSNRHIPTAREMDEFFALAEEKQQRLFIEKYNFDPVKETPLPGRYEWEKLQP